MSNKLVLFALAAVAAQMSCAPERSANRVSPIITEQIDESKLVALEGNTPPAAHQPENDLGPVADSFVAHHIQLLLRRAPAAEHELEQFLADLQDPSSPSYHHWLTAAQYNQRFGMADEDVAAVSGWLKSHGMRVNSVSSGMIIDFNASAAQVREAFHTELHALSVKGVRHIANMSDPLIPAALQNAVTGVVALHDFRPHNMVQHRTKPAYTVGNEFNVVPADLATIYNLSPLFSAGTTGMGQTVVVLEDTDVYTTEDFDTFRTTFGLDTFTSGSLTQVHPMPQTGDNNCAPPGVNGNDFEAILDTQWASASAPGASIVLGSCADTEFAFGGFLAMENILDQTSAQPASISISYGLCEADNGAASNAAIKAIYQKAVGEGVSVFVSSGDNGAAGCNQNDPGDTFGIGSSAYASTPYNVAVGGTDFGDTAAGTNSAYWSSQNKATFGSALSYIPEIPWNDSCASELIATYKHSQQTFGSNGFCNVLAGEEDFLDNIAGSGGPSSCAVGAPSSPGIVSGSCRGYAKPSWQSVLGNPNDGVRDLPDVSLFASNGLWGHALVVCYSDTANGGSGCTGAPSAWDAAGGTSFASPMMAGIQALVAQKWGAQGNPNPIYYKLAATEYGANGSTACNSSSGKAISSACIFNDVTNGDIDVNCTGEHDCYLPAGKNGVLSTSNSGYAPAFNAHAGWDFATGLGTVNATNLVNNAAWNPTPSQLQWTPPHR